MVGIASSWHQRWCGWPLMPVAHRQPRRRPDRLIRPDRYRDTALSSGFKRPGHLLELNPREVLQWIPSYWKLIQGNWHIPSPEAWAPIGT